MSVGKSAGQNQRDNISSALGNQTMLYSTSQEEPTLRNKSVDDVTSFAQNSEQRRNPFLVSLTWETESVAGNSNMLAWNLPALTIHLGVDGIRKIGPTRLVQLAQEYYRKPSPSPLIYRDQAQWDGQYLISEMESLNQRLKILQEEKQQLVNTHSFLAKTFREASLRELRKQ